MTSKEIRQQFLDFFKSKEHRIVPSAPVVPYDDPTLLFINAGMNQFKDVFLGKDTREYTRAADTQKCIRVSGKHNDLEEVGHDTYHHTFFEMLGNWSFGDYYKEEAIEWAWELLTEVWKLPKERLWATVFRTDDEAFELWKTKTDINPSHILRFDEKDNFWEMGDTGPCGPCSEIHINLSDDLEDASLVNAGVPECIEIWNLVFIQNNRDAEGKLHELPSKHVDTGMGFERVCAVLQGKKSNYDTDVFMPLINGVSELCGIPYEKEDKQIAMRVISDHVRTLTFAIGDGAVPSNDGRGYVLRRILRRGARYGRKLNLNEPFMYKLVDIVVKQMSEIFPEIKTNQENIEKIIKGEEESFNVTLDRGIELFEQLAAKADKEKSTVISGADVFKLYDTFGFPLDLTMVMAKEKGLSVDEKEFDKLMNEQRERARKSTKDKMTGAHETGGALGEFDVSGLTATEFTGYEELTTEANVLKAENADGNSLVVLDKSPFYVEAGGQVGDIGVILHNSNIYEVIDLKKKEGKIIHIVENEEGDDLSSAKVVAQVDAKTRWSTMRNHSATHFLHAALREVLGEHVQQKGSYVGPDRLRFDFSHFEKVTDEQIREIEETVNLNLHDNHALKHHKDTPFDKAKDMGALMFFGDKYGDKVNVVQFGDYTMEFCGGTHVKNSSQIGLFKIVSEASIASGIRRIEAVTGLGVQEYIESQSSTIKEKEEKIAQLNEEKKKLEKELNELQLQSKMGAVDSVVQSFTEVEGIAIYKGKVDAANMDELKQMGDELRNKIDSGIGVLFADFDGKAGIVCVVTDDLTKAKKAAAGNIIKPVAKILGGGGGGAPHMATAGGKDVSKIDEALAQIEEIVKNLL